MEIALVYMKKVLILSQGPARHYRTAVYNKLAEKYDVTVVYSEGEEPHGAKFAYEYIPTFKFHYYIHKKNLLKMANKFDVVICMFDFSHLYYRLLSHLPHKCKLIYWGIGVSAGYNTRYDENQKYLKRIMNRIKRADAMLFYTDYPVKKYSSLGAKKEKLFVADNTVEVIDNRGEKQINDSILFIGSLYKQKRIDVLLKAYENAYKKNKDLLKLVLIGDGEERSNIENWIRDNSLSEKVEIIGGIYDEKLLVPYFNRAAICVSPDQAGLSVLKSMGYGVPFVTHRNAITGGEIFNIHNGIDGVLMDNFDELETIISDASQNTEKYTEMGIKAREYYYKYRTVDHMVQGFCDAIDYVLKL